MNEKKHLSLSTITTAIATLQIRLEDFSRRHGEDPEHKWMKEYIEDMQKAIVELKEYALR